MIRVVVFFWISSNGTTTQKTCEWGVLWWEKHRGDNISTTQASATANGMYYPNVKRDVAEVATFFKRLWGRKKIANATNAITPQISVQKATAWMCRDRLFLRLRTRKHCNSLSRMWRFTLLARRQTKGGVSFTISRSLNNCFSFSLYLSLSYICIYHYLSLSQ